MNRTRFKRLLIGSFSVRRLALSALEIYLVILAWGYISLDRMVFRPPPSSYVAHDKVQWVNTHDGEQLAFRALIHPDARFTVLYTHGNAEDLGQVEFVLQGLFRQGFSVLSWDYRGYGLSTGRSRARNIYRDSETVFNFALNAYDLKPEQMLLYGRSVGAVPAVYLATRHDTAALVVESGFTTAFQVLTRFRIVPYEPMNNLARMRHIDEPVLVVHGITDTTIPFRHGQRLHRAALHPQRLVAVPGAGHNDVLDYGEDQLYAALRDLVQSLPGAD